MMESDNFATDPVARSSPGKPALAGRSTLLSFGSEFGLLTVVDLDRGKVAHTAKASTGDGLLFDGFTSMALTADGAAVHGVTPHVTEGGFCSDGCFRFGVQQIAGFHGGRFAGLGAAGLPFKAALADARYFATVGDVYYTQGLVPARARRRVRRRRNGAVHVRRQRVDGTAARRGAHATLHAVRLRRRAA